MKTKPLNQRQESILLSLKKLDYLNRDQLQRIHRLGQVRNANRVLRDLSPYLSRFRDEYAAIYYLNKEGREYVDSKKIKRKTIFVSHVIMRNEFYIFCGFPHDWKNEVKVSDGEFTVTCDSWIRLEGRSKFLKWITLKK